MHFAPPDETHERESPSLFQLSGPTIPRGQRWKALASPSYRVIVPPPTRGSISQAAKETVNSRHGCCFSRFTRARKSLTKSKVTLRSFGFRSAILNGRVFFA